MIENRFLLLTITELEKACYIDLCEMHCFASEGRQGRLETHCDSTNTPHIRSQTNKSVPIKYIWVSLSE